MVDALTPRAMAQTHARAFIQSRAWTADEFRGLLSNPLVFACGDIRCFAVAQVVAGEAELLTIATDPDHQRQGFANRIMKEWQTQAMNRDADEAFLEVAADNTPAIKLYETHGFVECGRRTGYYRRSSGPKVDAILMRRKFTLS